MEKYENEVIEEVIRIMVNFSDTVDCDNIMNSELYSFCIMDRVTLVKTVAVCLKRNYFNSLGDGRVRNSDCSFHATRPSRRCVSLNYVIAFSGRDVRFQPSHFQSGINFSTAGELPRFRVFYLASRSHHARSACHFAPHVRQCCHRVR